MISHQCLVRVLLLPPSFQLIKTLEQIYSLSRSIFVGMGFSKLSKQLLAAPGFLAIHNYNFQLNTQSSQAVFIEDEKNSYDVSPLIQQVLPCGDFGSWTFSNWRGESGSSNAIFIADAHNGCSPGHRYLLSVSVVFDRDMLF